MSMVLKLTESFFLKSWWVIVFLLGCLLVYEQESRTVYQEYQKLKILQRQLEHSKTQLLVRQTELQTQIQSQSDPQWVELTLKRGLGLVPQGQTKVYFYPQHSRH